MKLLQKVGLKGRSILTKFHHNPTLITENIFFLYLTFYSI